MQMLIVSKSNKKILIIGAVILLVRILYIGFSQGLQEEYSHTIFDYFGKVFSDHITLVTIFCMNIIFVVRLLRSDKAKPYSLRRVMIISLFVLSGSIFMTLLYNRDIVFFTPVNEYTNLWREVLLSFMALVIINAIFVFIINLVMSHGESIEELATERDQRHRALYQYTQLKQQLNPHFLFNSLNILDYLVQNEDKERASEYIRKLAGVYRYLLKQEDEQLVDLSDEINFVTKYTDLLKERFAQALCIKIDISAEKLNYKVIPCGLQILVENAVKHNVAKMDKPLNINISLQKDYIVVKNNLQLRYGHDKDSTKIGLKNLRKQYLSIADKEILVQQTDQEFIVKLPLI